MTIDGVKLRDSRLELKWARQKLVDRANAIAERDGLPRITLSAVAVIEQGKRQATDDETVLLKAVLVEALGRVMTEEVPAVVLPEDNVAKTVMPNGAVRLYEWQGLRRGDPCRVTGEKGVFTFQYHHEDPTQAYVEVTGPRVVIQGVSMGFRWRSFLPERIRPATKARKK